MDFANKLINWYLKNKRNLPWRNTKDAYFIWLSEIILQQTRVAQGTAYYYKFVEEFPTIVHLANATEEKVLKNWQGLGYYTRARNLHITAKNVVEKLNGKFPITYSELIKLKGVGDYTASAIASICGNEPTAVVDGNVYRVLSRFMGITTPINSSRAKKEFKEIAQSLICNANPGTFNQAIMELGAMVCSPTNPNCENCPVQSGCFAFLNNNVKQFPIKDKKIKIKNRFFNYLVIQTPNGKTKLEKRTKGIWLNLYQFPLIETKKDISVKELIQLEKFEELFSNKSTNVKLYNPVPIVHKLSHQHLITKFWMVNINDSDCFSDSWEDVEKFPVPALIHNFLVSLKTN